MGNKCHVHKLFTKLNLTIFFPGLMTAFLLLVVGNASVSPQTITFLILCTAEGSSVILQFPTSTQSEPSNIEELYVEQMIDFHS